MTSRVIVKHSNDLADDLTYGGVLTAAHRLDLAMNITAQTGSNAPQGRGDERVKLHGRAYLAQPGHVDLPPHEVELDDLSISGAGMVGPVEMSPGCAVVLLLELANHPAHGILGHVVSSKPLDNHQFRIGMAFDAADGPTIKRIRYAFFPQ